MAWRLGSKSGTAKGQGRNLSAREKGHELFRTLFLGEKWAKV
jgi:hypothetical protein